MCPVGVVGARRRVNLPLSRHVLFQSAAERRHVRPVTVVNAFWKRISLWCQEAPPFRHTPILLPVRGLLRNCSFWIFFYFFFLILTPSSVGILWPRSNVTSHDFSGWSSEWYLSNLLPGRIWHKLILMWGAMHESRIMCGCHKNAWLSKWLIPNIYLHSSFCSIKILDTIWDRGE